MKVVVINCFPSVENNRVIPILEFYEKRNDNVVLLTSDFNHYNKKKYIMNRENIVQLNVLPYKKNMSIARIISHFIFSFKVYKYVLREEPSIIYAKIPPNTLLCFLSRAKLKKKFVLIGDVYDLWPESMPSLRKEKFPFSLVSLLWKKIRDNNIECIDYTIYECNLYKKYIKNTGKADTLYLCRDDIESEYLLTSSQNSLEILRLCYIGNIGELIDLNLLVKLVKLIMVYKEVEVYIIGDGNNKHKMINALTNIKCRIFDCGIIFNEVDKAKIMGKCHFGLNFMKKDLIIGLSNKSIDYLKTGLPILNTVLYDTESIIEKYNAGYTIKEDTLEYYVKILVQLEEKDFNRIKSNARKAYIENFTKEIFLEKFNKINDVIMKDLE